MSAITRLSQIICLSAITLLIAPTCFISTVPLGNIGVRSSSFSGVLEADLEPGWHLSVASIHNLTLLPSRYLFLDYGTEDNQSLQIRTRDNNNVFVDVTVPYRIKPGEAHLIMKAGNHVRTNGDTYRFQRLATETTVSVLREDAQAAIGGVHADAEPLRAALGEYGLRAGQHVDLHDAGPVYEAHLDLLGCRPAMGALALLARDAPEAQRPLLVAAECGDEVWQLPGQLDGAGHVILAGDTAARLGWSAGQALWVGEA